MSEEPDMINTTLGDGTSLTLFDMGFFGTVSYGGGGGGGSRAPHHNFVVIPLMIMKFGTGFIYLITPLT